MAADSDPFFTYSNGCLDLQGVVDLANVAKLRSQGEQLIKQAGQSVVKVNLGKMKSNNSVSLSLLLCWIRYAHLREKKLKVVQLSQATQDLCTLYNLQPALRPYYDF